MAGVCRGCAGLHRRHPPGRGLGTGGPDGHRGRHLGNLFFGPTAVGIFRTSLALELGEHGQALQAAKAVHPELLPQRQQAFFWIEVGRALVAGKKTRHKGVQVLLHAEQLTPQRIRTDSVVREVVAGLLRQARRDAGGRELRGLAWRMGIAPRG